MTSETPAVRPFGELIQHRRYSTSAGALFCAGLNAARSPVAINLLVACVIALSLFAIPARCQDGREAVVDIDFVIRDSRATSNPCQAGWEWDGTDINAGVAGSKFVYLCYRRQAWTPGISPITDLGFTSHSSAGNRCPSGFTWIDKDLNAGAGADTPYIYACIATGGQSPIFNLKIVNSGPSPASSCGAGWRGNPQDLNQGTSFTRQSPYPTPYIYLCTKDVRSVSDSFPCGGENETPCGRGPFAFDELVFFDGNGNFGCDRGLREIDGKCKNAGNEFSRRHSDVNDFQGSWTEWAMSNQRDHLAMDEPLNFVTTIYAHNGFNNTADGYIVDPNHRFSFTDQLRLGVRNLNPDVVWYNDKLRLCHGDPNKGCSPRDRYYSNAIKEIANWLIDNPNEVVIINLEDRFNINDDTDDQVNIENEIYLWGPLASFLGDRVLKVSDFSRVVPGCSGSSFNDCRWPTRREMLRAGKQVIVFGHNKDRNTGWIWPKSAQKGKDANATSFNFDTCNVPGASAPDPGDPDSREHFWDGNLGYWNRVGEDRTILTAAGAETGQADWIGFIDEERIKKLVRCGVPKITLDFVHAAERTTLGPCNDARRFDGLFNPCPDPDNRLKKTIWSWAEDDFGNFGDRALYSHSSERWHARFADNERHHFACAKPREGDPKDWIDKRGEEWRVTSAVGYAGEGHRVCEQEFGSLGFVFATPTNGFQNERLKSALSVAMSRPGFDRSSLDVWLNYRKGPLGNWIIERGPRVNLTGRTEIVEGEVVTFDFNLVDDGIDDGRTGIRVVSVSCGSQAEEVPGSLDTTPTNGRFSCSFLDNKVGPGSTHVVLRVANEQGAVRNFSLQPRVSNHAPQLGNVRITPQIDENGVATLTGSIIDPGVRDRFTLSVRWRNSEPVQTYAYPAGTTSFQIIRHYLDDDPTASPSDTYQVAVLVNDDDNASSLDVNVPVTVRNLSPVVTMSLSGFYRTSAGSSVVPVRTPIGASGSFTDAGTLDTHTSRINWNDGTPHSTGLTGTHTYLTAGQYAVIVSVTDDDQGTGTAASPIEVAAPSRAASVAGLDLRALAGRADLSEVVRAALNDAIIDIFGSLIGQTKAGAANLLATGSLDAGVDKIRHALTRVTIAQDNAPALNLVEIRNFLALTTRSTALGEIARAQAVATKPDQQASIQEAINLIAAGDVFLKDGLYIKAAEKNLAALIKVKGIL
jgi:hypothetical protein